MRNVLKLTVQWPYILAIGVVLASDVAGAQKRGAPPPADAQQMLGVQVALDRAGFSPGEIDGRGGPKTRLALSELAQDESCFAISCRTC